jgi:hypothetical protein
MKKEEREGAVAKAIEQQTAKLPSDVFLWSALGAMGASLTLKLCRQDHMALFIGQWAAPFLLFGIYDKIVKTQGSERNDD